MTLSIEDQEVLNILEVANKQYEEYLAITAVTSLITAEPPPEQPVYNWERPLTLVLSKDR